MLLICMVGSYAGMDDVRRLAGGIGSIPNEALEDFLEFGNIMIESCSGLSDLATSDPRYAMMEQGSEYYASAAVKDHYADKLKSANTHWERAAQICEAIIKFNLTGSQEARSISQDYMTYPLNEESGKYFSNRYVDVGSGTNVFSETP